MAQDRETIIDLGLERRDFQDRTERAELRLTTRKPYSGGLQSSARVDWVGNGWRSHALGFGAGGDFSGTVLTNKTARATQKAIDTQHATAFPPAVVEELTLTAKAYYGLGKNKR